MKSIFCIFNIADSERECVFGGIFMKHYLSLTLLPVSIMIFCMAANYNIKAASTTTVGLMRPSKITSNQTTNFDLILRSKDQAGAYQRALAVNTPGSPNFKQYLTATEFRQKYGQPASVTNRWQKYLKLHGLKATVFSNGLIINVSGRASVISKVFKVNLENATYHKNVMQFGKNKPNIPSSLSKSVQAIIGITDHNSRYVFPNSQFGLSQKRFSDAGSESVSGNFGYTNQFTDHYGVNQLYREGLTGQGQTIGIIAFEGFHRADVFHFWKHENVSIDANRLSTKYVTGNLYNTKLKSSEDSSESVMDVEYAGSIAPQAKVRVFRVKSPVPTLMNLVNAYATVYDSGNISTVSTSWGLGSTLGLNYLQRQGILPNNYPNILSMILAQGALEGVSTFTGSGDQGAQASYFKGVSHGKAVIGHSLKAGDVLPTNPWIISVGGTTLPNSRIIKLPGYSPFAIQIQNERAWGYDSAISAVKNNPKVAKFIQKNGIGYEGSGGGFSELYPTPRYQRNISGVNTFNARQFIKEDGSFDFNPELVSGIGSGRNYPDLAVDADPFSGYYVYQKSGSRSGWFPQAGTSIAGPQVTAVAALINSAPDHRRMGFWNPQIYQLAQQTNSPFTPLNSSVDNSNTYYTGQADTIYNQATGLGVPEFAKLYNLYE
ncbi:MAG: S53 family peptidase [Lentilactobacillus sunkii]